MRRRLLLIAGALVVAWALLAALWLVRLASDLRAGRDAASSARDHLSAEEVADLTPLAALRSAAVRLGSAHDRADGFVLRPLRFVPVVGRHLRSVAALSGAAEEVASAGAVAVERAGAILERPAVAGSARVAQVEELGLLIDDVAVRLATIDDLGPVDGLLAPLARARNDLSTELAKARRSLSEARAGARAALSLIRGPRRYLVVAANNAEMRAGSGMWLQGGALVTRDGTLALEKMSPLYADHDPPAGAVVPTGDLADRWGFLTPGDDWQNLMASPRFEASARLAVQMWKAAGRGDVDGVIAVDAVGLRAIVEATGPVQVGDETLAAPDLLQEILHDQYLSLGSVVSRQSRTNADRQESLARLANAAIGAIDAGRYEPSTLVRTLAEAVKGRHLMAWSTDEVEQRGWTTAGMDGALSSDSLLVSVVNRGANKLDWFLRTDATLAVASSPSGWEVTVEITLSNQTPAGEPTYIAGPFPGVALDPGEYRGILTVNVPGPAIGSRFDDVGTLAVVGADGPTRVVGFPFELPRGASRTVVLRFTLPSAARHVVVEPSARVPGIAWRYGAEGWRDDSSRVARW